MPTFYCTNCWAENRLGDKVCWSCGAPLDDEVSYKEKLIKALSHPEPQTPVRAAWLLGELEAREAVPQLIRAVQASADPYLQEAAVEALGKIGDLGALPVLMAIAQGQGYVKVRLAAVEAIMHYRDRPEVIAFLEKLAQEDNSVGRRAREVLASRKD